MRIVCCYSLDFVLCCPLMKIMVAFGFALDTGNAWMMSGQLQQPNSQMQKPWALDIDSVGDLNKMIVSPLPAPNKRSYNKFYENTSYVCERILNEISKQQLAKMLMILRVNRDWFSLIQSRDRKNDYYDLYSDILQICIFKVNQHQLVHVRMDRLLKAVSSFLRSGNRLSRLKEKLIYINFGAIWNALCQDLDLIFIGNQKSHSKYQMNILKGTWMQSNGRSVLTGVFAKRQLYRQQTGSLEKTQQIMKMSLQECLTSQQIETLDSIYSLIEERRKRIKVHLGEKLAYRIQDKPKRDHEQIKKSMRQVLLKIEQSAAFDDPLILLKQYTLREKESQGTMTVNLKQLLKESRLLSFFKEYLCQQELDKINQNSRFLDQILRLEEETFRLKALETQALETQEDMTLTSNEKEKDKEKENQEENKQKPGVAEGPSEKESVLQQPRTAGTFTAVLNNFKKKDRGPQEVITIAESSCKEEAKREQRQTRRIKQEQKRWLDFQNLPEVHIDWDGDEESAFELVSESYVFPFESELLPGKKEEGRVPERVSERGVTRGKRDKLSRVKEEGMQNRRKDIKSLDESVFELVDSDDYPSDSETSLGLGRDCCYFP